MSSNGDGNLLLFISLINHKRFVWTFISLDVCVCILVCEIAFSFKYLRKVILTSCCFSLFMLFFSVLLVLEFYGLIILQQVEKSVFVIFFSGERAKNKILKICDAFGANRYPFTDDLGNQFQMITEVHSVILMRCVLHTQPATEHCISVESLFNDCWIMLNTDI